MLFNFFTMNHTNQHEMCLISWSLLLCMWRERSRTYGYLRIMNLIRILNCYKQGTFVCSFFLIRWYHDLKKNIVNVDSQTIISTVTKKCSNFGHKFNGRIIALIYITAYWSPNDAQERQFNLILQIGLER